MSEEAPKLSRPRVLFVTYAFPPVAYVGVLRSLKYCRYLPEFGWDPIVLTARPSRWAHTDPALCDQVPPGVKVHRTWDVDPAKWLLALGRLRRKKQVAVVGALPSVGEADIAGDGIVARVKRRVIALLTESPDSHVFWVPFAFCRGTYAMLTKRVDVIFSTSPPHSSHLATLLLATFFRKPYVVDFRDPWTMEDVDPAGAVRFSLFRGLERWSRRRLVQGATHVFTVSAGECADIRREFRDCNAAKFSFITNGYDPADFPREPQPKSGPRRVTLTHTGTVYPGAAGAFFDALREMVVETPTIVERLSIDFAGDIADQYLPVVHELQATGLLRWHGMQAHRTALEMMLRSDALLILLGGPFGPAEIPAKVFEYMHAAKPIITVAHEGELVNMVKSSGLGMPVIPEDIRTMKRLLYSLQDGAGLRMETRRVNRSYVEQFERRKLTERLAAVLDNVNRGSK